MNMKIKTESGVSISTVSGSSLVPGSSSVLIIFDKPVMALELTKQELPRLAALLAGSDIDSTNHFVELPRKQNQAT
jgi:hypothetical protein